ncbi:uncharacterized protein [Rutidosis leptorrhynchoides]|uniref:uncharacterized protein n=1 Tax=Rutidosis leptorrhynchoides TaxID=125765 RepID=UPI003A9A2E62
MLTKAATDKGLFKGVKIGNDNVQVSHLQYADDTIFLGEWSQKIDFSLQNLLKCFELVSGLKVNFHKSCLYGIGISIDEIGYVASRLGCKVGSFPFTYLGLPIGEKMNKLKNWNPVIRLEASPEALISEKVELGDAGPRLICDWIRTPTGRTEGELLELTNIIAGYNFDITTRDSFKWALSTDGKFTVNRLSSIIDAHSFSGNISAQETLRNSLVPKKLELLVWRANLKRLPVRVELDNRGIDLDSVRCPLCDEDLETIDHAFIFCNQVMDIWNRVFSWWGFGNISSFSINEILQDNVPVTS